MLKITTLAVALMAAGALGLAGCDVKKIQEGNAGPQKSEAEKKQSGDATGPKYEVTSPDVKVGSTEKTVKVPKITITTEEKKVQVPTIEVRTAKEKEQGKQESR
jgi:hypothetical protein